MLKYDLNEEVYYLRDEKIQKGKIIARKFSDQIADFAYYTDGPENQWINKVTGGAFTSIYIVNDKGIISAIEENKLFKSDKELVDSLYKDFVENLYE